MTMWGFSYRRDDEAAPESGSPRTPNGKRAKRRIVKRRGKKQNGTPTKEVSKPKNPTVAVRRTLEEQAGLNVSETGQGIEILLDWNAANLEARDLMNHKESSPVFSLAAQIAQRQKVSRAQFSTIFPTLGSHKNENLQSGTHVQVNNHRVPLVGQRLAHNVSYNEMIRLLQSSEAEDEITSVREELKKMASEIDALEQEKVVLEKKWMQVKRNGDSSDSKKAIEHVDWDINRLLSQKGKLTTQERKKLETNRGLYLTLYFQSSRVENAFLSNCGIKNGKYKSNKRKTPGSRITLDPDDCRAGGAGTTVQHFALMKGTGNTSAFFLSRDNGKSCTWGHLPPKLFWRMKHRGMDPQNAELGYLSTGPKGCYYAEFQSGERWWGCAGEDSDFHAILQEWDVYRVVFGSFVTFMNEDGKESLTGSWLILGRDGRAAWKNLPSRLHQTLESRLANSAAPVEVALGSGESYYVRFLDGTMDYCLPADMASVCENIEKGGGMITGMALHPDVSHEFIIRHTKLLC